MKRGRNPQLRWWGRRVILELAVLAQADNPSGMDPLRAFGIFVGFPALITALVIVAVYAGRWRSLLRQRRKGVIRSRPGELPPLTEPVLGTPGQPVRLRASNPQPRRLSRTDTSPSTTPPAILLAGRTSVSRSA